ncbi:MAG TPA: flagellar FliJ family protein [Dongiaceae bacterium]|nr:flagellar FliJ family protein [Dongiaceae bacterium]
MAFRFPLESLLHLCQSLEHQQELRLRAANQQVLRVRHLIEQLESRIQKDQLEVARNVTSGLTGAEIRFELEVQRRLQHSRQQLQLDLSRVVHLRDEQQKLFGQARRKRQTYETLRDEQFHQHQREQTRRDQRLLDELFLYRQAFRKRGQKLPE